jgi:hypothetical protein
VRERYAPIDKASNKVNSPSALPFTELLSETVTLNTTFVNLGQGIDTYLSVAVICIFHGTSNVHSFSDNISSAI